MHVNHKRISYEGKSYTELKEYILTDFMLAWKELERCILILYTFLVLAMVHNTTSAGETVLGELPLFEQVV